MLGFCFATSASKARMICARSAWDAGYASKITDIKVHRQPAIDGRTPAGYRNELFSMEYMQHLPLLPNAPITGPVAGSGASTC
jgi:hypothetical protein